MPVTAMQGLLRVIPLGVARCSHTDPLTARPAAVMKGVVPKPWRDAPDMPSAAGQPSPAGAPGPTDPAGGRAEALQGQPVLAAAQRPGRGEVSESGAACPDLYSHEGG